MSPAHFKVALCSHLDATTDSLIGTIPEGSGIFHFANVSLKGWNPGFVSVKPGRWTAAGRPNKCFADDFAVCLGECGHTISNPPPDDHVLELWETTRELPVIDIHRLPDSLKTPLFEDVGGPPPSKWEKPGILLQEIRLRPKYDGIQCVYAPSASGQALLIGGSCFVANPPTSDVRRIWVGTYEHVKSGIFS